MTTLETIIFYVCLGVVPSLFLGIMLMIHSKQCKKAKEMEKNNVSNMKELSAMEKRIEKVEKEKMNKPRSAIANLNKTYKEAENEEKNEEENKN